MKKLPFILLPLLFVIGCADFKKSGTNTHSHDGGRIHSHDNSDIPNHSH